MNISAQKLISILQGVHIPSAEIRVLDRSFQTIEDDEVMDLHGKWVHFLPSKLIEHRRVYGRQGEVPMPRWVEDCWDCDNHATDFLTFCCRSNAYTMLKTGKKRGGLALGRMSYISVGNGRVGAHAINLFAMASEGIRFFEPADGRVVQLTREEVESAWDVWFI